jgi:hypothetical protein
MILRLAFIGFAIFNDRHKDKDLVISILRILLAFERPGKCDQ